MPVRVTYDKETLEVMENWDPNEMKYEPDPLFLDSTMNSEDFARITVENVELIDIKPLVGSHKRRPKQLILTPDLKSIIPNPAYTQPLDVYELNEQVAELKAQLVVVETRLEAVEAKRPT